LIECWSFLQLAELDWLNWSHDNYKDSILGLAVSDFQNLLKSAVAYIKRLPIKRVVSISRAETTMLRAQTTTTRTAGIPTRPESLYPWAQFGGGHGGRVPHFFRWGDIICHVLPTFFSLDFVFGEVSKIKVMLVTFCVKSFSC